MNTNAYPPIPSELVSLLGSSMLGSSLRLFSFLLMARHRERLMQFNRSHTCIEKSIVSARRASGLQLTRRLIALSVVFFVIIWPKIVAVFFPEIPIAIGYSQIDKGFFLFSSNYEKMHWMQLKGLVLTPLDTHLLSAIIGLYFGSALVDFKH
jgi:hypothetical protein